MPGKMNIPRDCFQYLAHWAWWRQGIALQYPSLKLHEETLTQMLLLQMAEWLTPLGMRVKLFSRANESKHGADWEAEYGEDWEWFYRDRQSKHCKHGLRFRVQAKRLYPDGTYQLNLKQARNLIKEAGKCRITPLYVFYNHGCAKNSDLFRDRSYHEFFDCWPQNGPCRWQGGESVWGCSIAKASFVACVAQQHQKANLLFLQGGMLPWHILFGAKHRIPKDDCSAKVAISSLPSYPPMEPEEPEEPDKSRRFKLPEWVKLLNSYARTRSPSIENKLNDLLKEHKLAGVVSIDASSPKKK